MIESFKNTPVGNKIVNKILGDKQATDNKQSQAINKIIKHIKNKENRKNPSTEK
jgi:hypothetical protein